MRSLTGLPAVLVLLIACSGPATGPEDVGPDAEVMLTKHSMQVLRARPVQATQFGLRDGDVGARVEDAVGDYGKAHLGRWRKDLRRMRRELDALPPSSLGSLTRSAMDDIYANFLGGSEIPFGFINTHGRHQPYIINQLAGPLQVVPTVIAHYQPAATAEEVGDYLRRLWALSPLVAGVLDTFNKDANAGWMPPTAVLEAALVSLEAFVAPPAEEHELVVKLVEKMAASDALTDDDRARARNEAIAVMLRMVYPAYQNAIQNVRDRLQESIPAEGLWARPLGERFYRAALKLEADTSLGPEDVHAHGLAEVARISAEMDMLLRAQGYTEGSVGERMQALAQAEEFQLQDTEAGRADLLDTLQQLAAGMQERLPDYFGRLPKQGLEVRPVPEARQHGAPRAYYTPPPVDGSGPGVFWINLRGIDQVATFRLPTLVYHEAVPGHHLQVALSREQRGRPLLWRLSVNSAYSEGWAMYAELLAAEMGVYREDPIGDLGRLEAELFRAVRLVVDTGIHQQRWSLEQAVNYMAETTGRSEDGLRVEVLRYMVWPGQALAYKLGMDGLLELRTDLGAARGEGFVLKDFHDEVLATGPVSLPLLRARMLGE
jgi:uncharacterized protein (DUF885 family)